MGESPLTIGNSGALLCRYDNPGLGVPMAGTLGRFISHLAMKTQHGVMQEPININGL